MKSFQFRLQPLMNLRVQEEELWKLKLAQAARRVAELDVAIDETKLEENLALQRYREPLAMHAAQLYMLKMKADRERYQRDRAVAEEKRLVILKDYTAARQKAEVMRKLRGRQLADWQKKYMEYQDVQVDDVVAARRVLQIQAQPGLL